MDQYKHLGEYLAKQPGNYCSLTFSTIEAIIGDALPPSARTYPGWWGNDRLHPQALSWMQAGWITDGPDLGAGKIRFVKTAPEKRPDEALLAQVTVRNLDPAVVARLKQRAKRNGVSLEQELRTLLTRAVRPPASGP